MLDLGLQQAAPLAVGGPLAARFAAKALDVHARRRGGPAARGPGARRNGCYHKAPGGRARRAARAPPARRLNFALLARAASAFAGGAARARGGRRSR